MPVISGLSEGTKLALSEYCYRTRKTQIQWVEEHLAADLKRESEQAPDEGKENPNHD